MANASMTRQFLGYAKTRRKFWLLPILFMLLGLGAFLAFAHGSVLAPLIYTIF